MQVASLPGIQGQNFKPFGDKQVNYFT